MSTIANSKKVASVFDHGMNLHMFNYGEETYIMIDGVAIPYSFFSNYVFLKIHNISTSNLPETYNTELHDLLDQPLEVQRKPVIDKFLERIGPDNIDDIINHIDMEMSEIGF